MNVLLIGSGGREDALAWKLAQSPSLDTLFAAPGNPGIARHATCVAMDVTDHGAVIDFARGHAIGLVVIGPEAPLVAGLADDLRAANVPVFGPGKAAAQLEGSKGFTKALCARANIPTADYAAHTDTAAAIADLDRFGLPVVIKADGLAGGKGVIIADTVDEARDAVTTLLKAAPDAAIVIEAFMEGEEASLFALTDGAHTYVLASAQDHKRLGDGDTGPNTGGMGAYSPAPCLTATLETRAMRDIVLPTVAALNADGTPFVGVLYAGLMLTDAGPKLVEYNARFGDPETQAIMPRIDSDLVTLFHAVATGRLAEVAPPALKPLHAMTVVVAADGYPHAPVAGGAIGGLDAAEATGAIVFHAGTRAVDDGRLVASGGRVLGVTATGDTLVDAHARAYAAVAAIDYPHKYARTDIGARALNRTQ